jgi:hypothetical protein
VEYSERIFHSADRVIIASSYFDSKNRLTENWDNGQNIETPACQERTARLAQAQQSIID